MKDIVSKITEGQYSEWHDVKCVKEYIIERKTGNITFKADTEYKASKINDNWLLIDQIGVPVKDFKKYFKDIK